MDVSAEVDKMSHQLTELLVQGDNSSSPELKRVSEGTTSTSTTTVDDDEDTYMDIPESSEQRALRIRLIVEHILYFCDFSSLQVCRQVSKLFNTLSTKQLFHHHYLSIDLNPLNIIPGVGSSSHTIDIPDVSSDEEDYYDDDGEFIVEVYNGNEPDHPDLVVVEATQEETERLAKLKSFLIAHSTSTQIRNVKLRMHILKQLPPSHPFFETFSSFAFQIVHLHLVGTRLYQNFDLIIQICSLFPLPSFQSFQLTFSSTSYRDHCEESLLSILKKLKTFHTNKIGWPTLQSFLKLENNAPPSIKCMTVQEIVTLTDEFLDLHQKAVTKFGFNWIIPEIDLNLSPSRRPFQFWDFFSCQKEPIRRLSLDLSYEGSFEDEPTPNLYHHYIPPASLNKIESLEMQDVSSVSFFSRHFLTSLNLSSLKTFFLNHLEFSLHHQQESGNRANSPTSQIQEMTWNADIENLRTLHQIAHGLERHSERQEDSHILFQSIWRVFDRKLGHSHQFTLQAQDQLIRSMIVQGKFDEGLVPYFTHLKNIYKLNSTNQRSFPPFCPLTLKGFTALRNGKVELETLELGCRENFDDTTKIMELTNLKDLCKEILGEEGGSLFLNLTKVYVKILGSRVSSEVMESVERLLEGKGNSRDGLKIFRNIFELSTHNSKGFPTFLGNRGGSGGDTGMSAGALYYCGRTTNNCRCGQCDDICGMDGGCPCNSCVELLGFKVNREGVLCKKGSSEWGTGGDTGLECWEVYYCGRRKGECRCRTCDQRCGPNNGCPCNACKALLGLDENNDA